MDKHDHPVRGVCGLRRFAQGLGLVALAVLVAAMLVLGLNPKLAAACYFHPARDPLWSGLLAQLVHLSPSHLLLNLGGLLGLGLLGGLLGRLAALPAVLLGCALAVSIGLQHETPALDWYVGLSGALYGVWAWLALDLARQAQKPLLKALAIVTCLMVGAKATLGGASLLTDIPIAHSAHVYGYAGGLICAACSVLMDRRKRT